MFEGRPAWAAPLAIALAIAAAAIAIDPRGEFPIIDDWDYAATVSDLLTYGELRLSDWPAMTLVGQVYWGALFCSAFGFSYLALRASTVVLLIVGALALYAWARLAGRTRGEGAFLALLYGLTPLSFSLGVSFMTDVPGASLMLLGFLAAAWAQRRQDEWPCFVAGLVACAGYSVRQTAVLPALLLAAALATEAWRDHARVGRLLALVTPLVVTVWWHLFWLENVHGAPYWATVRRTGTGSFESHLEAAINLPVLLGFYLGPLAPLLAPQLLATRRTRVGWALLAAGLVAAAVSLGGQRYAGDFLLLFEALTEKTPNLSEIEARHPLFTALFAAAMVAFAAFALALRPRQLARGTWSWSPRVHAALGAAILLALAVSQDTLHPRYLIPVLPLLSLVLLETIPPGRVGAAGTLTLLGLALLSVLSMQEFFARGRARKEAVELLVREGLDPRQIGAGLEHAGAVSFEPVYRGPRRIPPFRARLAPEAADRWDNTVDARNLSVQRRPYELTLQPAPLSRLVATVPWHGWVRDGQIYVYQR